MTNFKMYLQDDATGKFVDSVVVASPDENRAREKALAYFAKHGGLNGVSLAPTYEYTSASADISVGGNATQRSL
jgi:hypothetical protein